MLEAERIAKLEMALADYALRYGVSRLAREVMALDGRAMCSTKPSSVAVVEAGAQADNAHSAFHALSA